MNDPISPRHNQKPVPDPLVLFDLIEIRQLDLTLFARLFERSFDALKDSISNGSLPSLGIELSVSDWLLTNLQKSPLFPPVFRQ